MGTVRGAMRVRIVSGDIPALLDALSARNIPVLHARVLDPLTIELEIPRKGWRELSIFCDKRGDDVKIISRSGLYWKAKMIAARPVLLAGILILTFLTFFLPTRVLFVEVEGNVRVPDALILEEANRNGIRFGVSRREVRSEHLKNALLEAIPSLQWAGINTNGCTAVISVREREESPEAESEGIGHVVAAVDGIILTTNAVSGTCLCHPGDAVRQGQVLISGYTDLGIAIRASRARGEIFAQTRREISVVTPAQATQKGDAVGREEKFSLRIGKKRINFWKGSGICDTSCDRIYVEKCITLPGGFQLPIAVIRETIVYYDDTVCDLMQEEVVPRLENFASVYLLGQMVSGRIVDGSWEVSQCSGVYVLEGRYLCTEMIGRFRQEKIGE